MKFKCCGQEFEANPKITMSNGIEPKKTGTDHVICPICHNFVAQKYRPSNGKGNLK